MVNVKSEEKQAHWLSSLTLVTLVQLQEASKIQYTSLLGPLLHLTCEAGAVNDKDLTVSSNHGNVWLYVHPILGTQNS